MAIREIVWRYASVSTGSGSAGEPTKSRSGAPTNEPRVVYCTNGWFVSMRKLPSFA